MLVASLGVALVISFGTAWLWTAMHSAAPPEPPEKTAAHAFRPTTEQWATLKVTAVEARAFQTEQVTDGTIAYDDDGTTPVFSPYSGRVTKLFARLGDVVMQGAPLMAVEASEFAQAESDIATARAQASLATQTEKRQYDLYVAKGGALKDWLQAQADLTAAQGSLLAARNRLRILGKTDAEIDALERRPARSLKGAETVIRAPIAGTVIQRQVGLGQFISAGASTAVYSIGNLATVWVVASVRETLAPQVRVGMPIDVHVLAYPHRVVPATIAWVAPAVDPATHRLFVRADLDNRDGSLKPMMFVDVTIHAGDETRAPAVPKSAIVYEGQDARVYVVRDDGSVALKEVHIGRSAGDMEEVTEGLAVGERIVSGGTLFIDRAADAGT